MKKFPRLFHIFMAALPVVVLGWKFLPFNIALFDVFLLNQTIRLLFGLMLLLYWFFLLFSTFFSRRVVALGIIASALLLGDALYYSGKGIQPPRKWRPDPTFTVYSQNILTDAIKRKRYDLFDIIRRLNPDVVVLQEVSDFDIEILMRRFAEIGYDGYPLTDITSNEALGFAVFSKLPVRNAQPLMLSGVDWSPLWPLQALEFYFNERWICCLNLHLMPPHHGEKGVWSVRPMQQDIAVKQAQEIIEFIECGDKPAIICGDFNQTPTSRIMRLFRKHFGDSFWQAGDGFGFTWNKYHPLFRIDYILYNDTLEALRSEIVKTNYSDHLGIFSEFKFSTN